MRLTIWDAFNTAATPQQRPEICSRCALTGSSNAARFGLVTRQGKIELVALTSQGKRLLEREDPGTGQVFYERFVKPAEILHDAAIYRMFKAEADRIEAGRRQSTPRRFGLRIEAKSVLSVGQSQGSPGRASTPAGRKKSREKTASKSSKATSPYPI